MEYTNVELLRRAIDSDKEALEVLVENNSGLIWSIVRRFLNRGYDKDELYQIGCIGLIKAIKRFDFNYNTEFSTYAVPVIMGEIKRFLRDDGIIKVSRNIRENAIKINHIREEFSKRNSREITLSELQDILNIDKEDILIALDSLKVTESLDVKVDANDSNSEYLIDKICLNKNEEEQRIDKLLIRDYINSLAKREREIIIMRYYRGVTQSKVASMMGISQVQVSRIEKKILEKMRKNYILNLNFT